MKAVQENAALEIKGRQRAASVVWNRKRIHLVKGKARPLLGARIETPFPVNTTQLDWQGASAIAPLGAGALAGKSYVVLWWSQRADSSAGGIVMQRFMAP